MTENGNVIISVQKGGRCLDLLVSEDPNGQIILAGQG